MGDLVDEAVGHYVYWKRKDVTGRNGSKRLGCGGIGRPRELSPFFWGGFTFLSFFQFFFNLLWLSDWRCGQTEYLLIYPPPQLQNFRTDTRAPLIGVPASEQE